MRFRSRRDAGSFSKIAACLFFLLAASLLTARSPVGPRSASAAAPSFVEMARIQVSDGGDREKILTLFHGYAALGLWEEAAAYLEQKVRLGQLSRADATPLFERILVEQSRWDDPAFHIEICETAIRNGFRTPLILYSYGTELRLAGRLSDASAIFARIGSESALHPFALYALGQIASQEGDDKKARELFGRVQALAKDRPDLAALGRRVLRSRAELTLLAGEAAKAAPLWEAVAGGGDDLLPILGRAAAEKERPPGEERLAEMSSGMPARRRILLSLLLGGLARQRGDFDEALAHIAHADEEVKSSLLATRPPASEHLERYRSQEFLDREITVHAALRQELEQAIRAGSPDRIRHGMVELLVGILVMDHAVSRVVGLMPPAPGLPAVPVASSRQIEEVLEKIEEVTLEGTTVDALAKEFERKIDILQNIGLPLDRYRLLTRLAKSHEEILQIKGTIRHRMEDAVRGVRTGAEGGSLQLFADLGRFLGELEVTREVASEERRFLRRHFDVLKERDEGDGGRFGDIGEVAREVEAFDRDRFGALLPSVEALGKRARAASWARRKQEILLLRPVVRRQLADVYVAEARSLRSAATPEWSAKSRALLEKAAAVLSDEAMPPADKADIAVRIASLLVGAKGGIEEYPATPLGAAERPIVMKVLPWLKGGSASEGMRERQLYLRALLERATGAADASSSARRFLSTYPSSDFAGDVAVRLGDDAIAAGRFDEAKKYFRTAARSGRSASSSIARYMLGWLHYHDGDSEGAVEELADPLSDAGFACETPSSFDRSVLALTVRAWMDLPPEHIAAYPPVRKGACGGRLLLASLGEMEEKRGETGRAAAVYDELARRFPTGGETLAYELKSVKDLLRAGREDEAFARAMALKGKYGPGSAWAASQPAVSREQAREELAGLIKTLSERKFEEGIRSGQGAPMAKAAEGLRQYFAVNGGASSGSNGELRLKLAVASLKSGDRDRGVRILRELATEHRDDSVGQRAALLYAQTVIAAYERKERTADDAEEAAKLLLERPSSEKTDSLAYRAAADMLAARDFANAVRTAGALEADNTAPAGMLEKARLVQAEAYVNLGDPGRAREKADLILRSGNTGAADPKVRDRATDLFLLSSLKIVEARTDAKDWVGAAKLLEELAGRFPKAPDAPRYLLRAVRSYREGGDRDAVERVGSLFLRTYPRRVECIEIAGLIGRYREDRNETAKAGDLYAEIASRFPENAAAGPLLFRAAQLARDAGDRNLARRRFAAYRERYPTPRWRNAYATLSVGLADWKDGKVRPALRAMEAGIRAVDGGVEADAPKDLFEVAGNAQIAIGEYWADQFRKLKLTAPLEKNLAIKDRFFRRSLEAFEKAERRAPLEVALSASERSGDLLVEFGKAVLASQRPKGMSKEERARYEVALADRARPFFERSLDWYVAAIDRLEAERGPSDLAIPIRKKLEEVQRLLAEGAPAEGGK